MPEDEVSGETPQPPGESELPVPDDSSPVLVDVATVDKTTLHSSGYGGVDIHCNPKPGEIPEEDP